MSRSLLWAFTGLALAAAPGAADLPPSQAVDQPKVCFECHDLQKELAAPVKHPPAAQGKCTSCHSPHVSRLDGLLRQQPGPLCAKCHADVTAELGRKVVHAPVAEGRCASCHPPHGASVAGLLAKPRIELCQGCHAEVGDWKARKVVHPPFGQGRCQECHEPHSSDTGKLLKAAGGGCTNCHAVDAAFRKLHGGYPVEKASCSACHDPHASARKGLLREKVHEPFADGDCSTCHVSSTAANPFALVKPQAELCGDCHSDQVEAAQRAPFPHVPAGGGRCTDCHNPHAGEGKSLLQAKGDETCLTCHDPGGASSGQPGRFAQHAGKVACINCHAPHGSNQPLLFVDDKVAVCSSCHKHEHGVTHPLGEGTFDPRTGQALDCGSCHGIHFAPFPKILHADEVRDICISCHKNKARGNP